MYVYSTWIIKKGYSTLRSTCFEIFTANSDYHNISARRTYFFANSVKCLVLNTNNANKFDHVLQHRANRNPASEASYIL